jgi:Protein of unknown function (DUF1566)
MYSMRQKWLSIIGAVLVVGSLTTTIAVADDDRHKNPFTRILHKLDQILTKLDTDRGNGNHTLRWDTNHPSASRFVTLAAFHNQAVLDKNTGLVWEQAPATATRNWNEAKDHCANRTVGGTVGWRLPSVIELKSVQDPSLVSPFVPTMVFPGIQTDHEDGLYWSASLSPEGPFPWIVSFSGSGCQAPGNPDRLRSTWCVRGPMQEHAY